MCICASVGHSWINLQLFTILFIWNKFQWNFNGRSRLALYWMHRHRIKCKQSDPGFRWFVARSFTLPYWHDTVHTRKPICRTRNYVERWTEFHWNLTNVCLIDWWKCDSGAVFHWAQNYFIFYTFIVNSFSFPFLHLWWWSD